MKKLVVLILFSLLCDSTALSQTRLLRTMRTATETVVTPPPADFSCLDIGAVLSAGSYVENPSDTYTIVGHGTTYGTADAFHYCYRATSGNQEMIAQVTSCSNAMSMAQECGLMARSTIAAGAVNVGCRFGDAIAYSEWCTTLNGMTDSAAGAAITTGYMRMRVVGNLVSCASSPDGIIWTDVPVTTSPTLPDSYLIGLAVDSNDVAATTGVFSSVTLAEYDPEDFEGYRSHYQGDGADALGGRGCARGADCVCRVTSLTDEATGTWGTTGSLRDCWEGLPVGCSGPLDSPADCARYLTFGVSGRAVPGAGGNVLRVTGPYLTIAGQTAPSCDEGSGTDDCGDGTGGVELYGFANYIDASHVVMQHVAIRACPTDLPCLNVGDAGDAGDNSHVHHTILDHVSITWNNGNTTLFSCVNQGACVSLLMVDSLVAEAVAEIPGVGNFAGNGVGVVQQTGCTVTMARNYIAHVSGRAPTWGYCNFALYNQLTYNVDGADVVGRFASVDSVDQTQGAGEEHVTNSVILRGPDSGTPDGFLCLYKIDADGLGTRIYLTGNSDDGDSITGATGDGQWNGTYLCTYDAPANAATAGPTSNLRTNTPFQWWTDYNFQQITNTGTAVRDAVLSNAGSRPLDRSSHDARIVADATELDGTTVTSFAQIVSLYGVDVSTVVVRTRTCTPPTSPTTVIDAVGRTRMDGWLEGTYVGDGTADCDARRLEAFQSPP